MFFELCASIMSIVIADFVGDICRRHIYNRINLRRWDLKFAHHDH